MQLHEQYRPKTFSEVAGQREVLARIERIRKRGLGGRAYWLSGASGTGKTTIAYLIAREMAGEWCIEEVDAGSMTALRVREIERQSHAYGFGDGKTGRAYIVNEAHGTAKTTTAAAFAVLLSRAGFRVHLVDSDPQASLTMAFGLTEPEGLLYQAMCRRGPLPVVTLSDRLSISPCSIDLSRGETQFISEAGREYILQTCLEKTGLDEDTTVILDCPPSLGVLSIGCLTAARYACVVVQPGGFELRTLVHLDETVRMLNERVNPSLSVIGAVLTNCHLRRLITEEVCREVAQHWPVLGQVRADARLLYATTSGKVHHLTRSNALQDYAAVVGKLREAVPWLARRSAA